MLVCELELMLITNVREEFPLHELFLLEGTNAFHYALVRLIDLHDKYLCN